jgi:hypothetical protein
MADSAIVAPGRVRRNRIHDKGGALRFHEIGPPTDDEMDRLLETIDGRIRRLLARRRVPGDVDEGGATDPWQDEAPVLAGIAAASVQSRRALGPRAGAPVRRMGASAELLALAPPDRGPCHARWNGFDLHAGVVVPPRGPGPARTPLSVRAAFAGGAPCGGGVPRCATGAGPSHNGRSVNVRC